MVVSLVTSTNGLWVMRRPVEQARHLPARVADAVAGDAHDRRDQLVIPDAAVVGAGDGAQLDPAVVGLQRLHQLGAVRQQPVLQVDAGERRRKLAQVARRRADQAAHLAEGPVGRRDRRRRGPARSGPGARRRRGSPRRAGSGSRRCAPWRDRHGRGPRRAARSATGSARRRAGRTTRTTPGRSARRGRCRPCRRP